MTILETRREQPDLRARRTSPHRFDAVEPIDFDDIAEASVIDDRRRSSALIGLAVGSAAVSVAVAVLGIATLMSGV